MVRCPGCKNLHLIADRLGYFDEDGEKERGGWDITMTNGGGDGDDTKETRNEELVRRMGEGGVLELTMEDLLGRSRCENGGSSTGDGDDCESGVGGDNKVNK